MAGTKKPRSRSKALLDPSPGRAAAQSRRTNGHDESEQKGAPQTPTVKSSASRAPSSSAKKRKLESTPTRSTSKRAATPSSVKSAKSKSPRVTVEEFDKDPFVVRGDILAVKSGEQDEPFWLCQAMQPASTADPEFSIHWLNRDAKDPAKYILDSKDTISIESVICPVKVTKSSRTRFRMAQRERNRVLGVMELDSEEEGDNNAERGEEEEEDEEEEDRSEQEEEEGKDADDEDESEEEEEERKAKKPRKTVRIVEQTVSESEVTNPAELGESAESSGRCIIC
eukprot:GILJ01003002.1.p1 GENE.GILJ01003002.1~~GILJ01003002.1.p1  ORF type:complete len:283 (+),score=56.13 GILJ01003002.1:40-888(+)